MALDVIVLTFADEIHPSWDAISSAFPHAKNISLSDDNVFKKILNAVNTSHFWIVFPEIEIDDFNFTPDIDEKKLINLFRSVNSEKFSSLLMSRIQFVKYVAQKSITSIFDLFSLNIKIHEERKGTDLSCLIVTNALYFGFETDENIIDINTAFSHILDLKTKYIWLILPNIDFNKFDFTPDAVERNIINLFKCENSEKFSAIFAQSDLLKQLIINESITSVFDLFSQDIKIHKERKGTDLLFEIDYNPDIILLSYFEPNAEQQHKKLLDKFGKRVKWVKDVKGIVNAHAEAARISSTHSFYVVDADADVYDTFNFDFKKQNYMYNAVFIWKSKNPLNDLIYGYGGIKLFNKSHFSKLTTEYSAQNIIDFTTSVAPVAIIDEVVCETKFNITPLATWRSAFRECAKLSSDTISISDENKERLKIWTTVAHGNYALYCLHGAKCGQEFGKNNKDQLNQINNFEWLESEFRSYFGF